MAKTAKKPSTREADLFAGTPRREAPRSGAANGSGKGRAGNGEDYTAHDIEVLEGLEPVRRRPGMYIGGTDEKALHHLFAEAIDNSMDEALAGHATFIEVDLTADGYLRVSDNGRGIPVDPHPKFPKKSALEVIMCTLHAGGKFDSKVYETSGGLHGVGISVVNALSEHLEVEVARGGQLYRQIYERGKPTTKLEQVGKVSNRRGTRVRFKPDAQIFGAKVKFNPQRLFKMARAKAYLFGGVEIRWHCDADLLHGHTDVPENETFRFPEGLKDYLAVTLEGQTLVHPDIFTGKSGRPGANGSVEWAIAWTADADGFLSSYCNTIPTADGGTHETGLRAALSRALKDHADRVNQGKRAAQITSEDIMTGAAAMLSVFIREPEFQGQTKDRLATAEATRIVENAVKDQFDHWLAGNPVQANRLLDFIAERAEERIRRRQEKEIARKTATRKLRLPGKLADCTNSAADGSEIFIVEGDSAGGSAKQARNRASQAILPLRGKILNVASSGKDKLAQPPLPRRGRALRQGDRDDRRRRGRRPHRVAAHHLLLQADAAAHRPRPPLSRGAAALPPRPRRQGVLRPRRPAQGRDHAARIPRQRQRGNRPLQGPRRDDAGAAQGNDDGPGEAHAAQGDADRRRPRRHGEVGGAADGDQGGGAV
jgi:topoisomerase-4 subunit B